MLKGATKMCNKRTLGSLGFTRKLFLLLSYNTTRSRCMHITRTLSSNVNTHSDKKRKKRNDRSDSKELSHLNMVNSQLSQQLTALEEMTRQVRETIKQKEDEKRRKNVIEETGRSVAEMNDSEAKESEIDDVFKALGISENEEINLGDIKKIAANDSTETPLVHNNENDANSIDHDKKRENEQKVLNFNIGKDVMSLFPAPKPYIPLPGSITSVLSSEDLSNITQKETANWEPVIDALMNSSICQPVPMEESFTGFDFHSLIAAIPRNQKSKLVEKLHEIALLSGVLWGNIHVMNDLLALCTFLPKDHAALLITALEQDIEMNRSENYETDADLTETSDKKMIANVTTKAILLNHYARMTDVSKVREYIAELNALPDDKNPMKTSPVIYTSIMQMYIRLDDYALAVETFDTMKFLSMATSPSSRTYTSMILLDTLHNNIEHGISVYEEMVEKDIKTEPEALLALAKGCGARRGMVAQGWNFIIKYYESGYPVDNQVMEIMMYLAYVDGDLPFVRGIWMNICETNTKLQGHIELPHPKCTKWLFNTYYRVGNIVEDARNGKSHLPVGMTDARVKSIRMKVMELANFKFHEDAPPLLPLIDFDGGDPKLMLSETRALWKYMLTTGHAYQINDTLIESYLYVVGRYGLLETFESEWEKLTVFDNEGIEEGQNVTIEEPEEEKIEYNLDSKSELVSSNDLAYPVGKIVRTDRLYNMCMHVARHHGSLSFAQKVWVERGQYRKTKQFQELSHEKQDEADFKFARLMLSVLTYTGNVGDAYKLVLSSQNRFVWSRYHLKSLLMLCERLGYVTFGRELMKVVKRGDRWARKQQRQQR